MNQTTEPLDTITLDIFGLSYGDDFRYQGTYYRKSDPAPGKRQYYALELNRKGGIHTGRTVIAAPSDSDVVSVVKAGRCSNGFESDHGQIRHAMLAARYSWGTHNAALCSTRPGRRSVGFIADPGKTKITCKRCLLKMHSKTIVDVKTSDPRDTGDWIE